jgi:large subunit ribosomal protein L18
VRRLGKKAVYQAKFRRRRAEKTNFYARKKLIMSRKLRFVVRISNKYVTTQVIEAEVIGDKVLISSHSSELSKNYAWPASCKNISATYLTSFLCGLKALSKGLKEAVLDTGLRTPSHGARVFAALKGASDAGLNIKHDAHVFPDDSRIRCEHIANYASKLSTENPKLYEGRYSQYLSKGVKPEDLPKIFDQVKSKIKESIKIE